MDKIIEKTTNYKTTQPKNEHATNHTQPTKNQYSNLVPRVNGFEESSSGLVVSCLKSSGRVVIGFEEEWKKFLRTLSLHDLDKLASLKKEVYFEKYPSRRTKPNLSRNVFRVFTGRDLLDFFGVIKPKEVKLGLGLFLQLTCGFRIGELSPIKLNNIDFRRGVISLITEKANVSSDQPVPNITLELLQEWIEHNRKEIEANNGFVFFSKNPFYDREVITKDTFRNYFQKFRKRSNLCSSYAERNDTKNSRHKTNRQLHKLSSHSFRRTYLTELYQECRKKELVKVLARHKKRDVTDQYIYFSHEEQLELVNKVFEREPFISIARDLIEKIKI